MIKISRNTAFGLVALLLVGATGVIVLTRDEFGDAKKAVKYALKDPDSAKFRNITKSLKEGDVVCGEVNARTTEGGYSGFHSFVYDRAQGLVVIMNEFSRNPGLMLKGLKYFQTGQCIGRLLY
jgi:hypothetical protein